VIHPAENSPGITPQGFLCSCVLYANERLLGDLLTSFLTTVGQVVVTPLGTMTDGERAACLAASHDLLVVVMDAEAEADGEAGGWDVASAFLEANPQAAVIVAAVLDASFSVPPHLDGRLAAVVDRSDPLRSLWNAVEPIVDAAARRAGATGAGHSGTRKLSDREADVLHLIGEGLTNREISAALELSVQAVRTYRKRIAAKVGAEGPDLMRWAKLAEATMRRSVASNAGDDTAAADAAHGQKPFAL